MGTLNSGPAEETSHRALLGGLMKIAVAMFVFIYSPAWSGTAFIKSMRVTGATKQCVYEYGGNEYTLTIDAAEICPQTLEVSD
jgi:hypothetical protein